MTNARRRSSSWTKQLILVLLFASALGGCSYFDEPTSLVYTRVGTVDGGHGIGEPFGIATKGDVVFISDGSTGTIWKIAGGAAPIAFATGLSTPSAIAFLPDGELVVADTGSHTIKKVGLDGTVTLLAGNRERRRR